MRRFVRYTLVGAIATAVHYGLLALVVELGGWPAFIGSGFGAVVGAQVAFFGNRWFTFGHAGELAPAWLKFQGTALFGALVGMVVVGIGVRLGIHYLAAQVVATLLSLVLTFVINRAWTFR
jgi:putative flippase GtrA